MAKEFFKDLPNTTTPLTSSRLNGLLDGEEAMGNIVVDSIKGKNLFDKKNVIKGYYYTSTGTSTSDNWCIEKIKVEPSTNYYLSGNNYSNTAGRILLFDSNNKILENVGGYSAVHLITTTSSTAYIGLSVANYSGSSDLDTLQLEKGSTATTYYPYQELDIDNLANKELVVGSIRSKNMFDKNTIVAGNISGGSTSTRLSSRQALWLEVGTYTFSTNLSSTYNWGVQVQNSGVPPISGSPTFILDSPWQSGTSYTFTINTAGYFNLLLKKSDGGNLSVSDVSGFNYQLETGSTATEYMPYQKLDYDYEEGNWTPVITTVENVAPTVTYTTQRGSYKKMGNIVFFNFYIRAKITALNGTNNYATITGLPYRSNATMTGEQSFPIGVLYSAISDNTNTTFSVQYSAIRIQKNYGASSVPWVVTSSSYMEVGGSGFYFTD